jgi:galactofuranosylgalactofuranosylrhamnosyl-N-acetylglucosaminyl-diphospho-decaprenol beta-1,5/1,6-galactofuranosyltransferase
MNPLQTFSFPNLDLQATEDMYLRTIGRAWFDLQAGGMHFDAGGTASTDTFFNGLTVATWKRTCAIRSLVLRVATLGLHRAGRHSVWVAEHVVALVPGQPLCLPVPAWDELDDGLLFVRLRALGPARLAGGGFMTPEAPPNDVRLGIVITHFNRPAQVLGAERRIRAQLIDAPAGQGRISLTVVDNSRNLPLPSRPGVDVLPNPNLGGTGGFVRGLLSLIDRRDATHALFMDDDAACEPASIARTLALLQYARTPRFAVAGALLREGTPWTLLEKGARFAGLVTPLHAGLDMRRVGDLLVAEQPLGRPDYGAWWFFAFAIADVRRFPFPFFVRGDDIFFGLVNGFDIHTLNGIACIGADFGGKHGPVTAYLDARYHLVHALLAPRGARGRIAWVGRRLFMKPLAGYLYASARAVTLAMEHVARGPAFFRDNLDMQAVRAEIRGWGDAETLRSVDRAALDPKPARRHHETVGRRWLRALTLQGFLLPSWLLRDRTTLQPKSFHGRASGVYRYRRVLYEDAATSEGFMAEFDRPRFFAELGRFLVAWGRLFVRLPALRAAYADGSQAMSTEEFWRTVYAERNGAAVSPQPPPPFAAAADPGTRRC